MTGDWRLATGDWRLATGDWRLAPEIRVGLRNFVVDKLPEDGTLVPKYVGVGTSYELCFVIYFIVLGTAFIWFKIWTIRKRAV